MTPRWLSGLVTARRAQEDTARQRYAFATRAADRAHQRARDEGSRVEAMQAELAARDTMAFVAAAVALQSAAATHAAAMGAADRADEWTQDRAQGLTDAAVARHTAEQLLEREQLAELRRAAGAAQRELDEIAATVHRRGATRPTGERA